MLITDKISNTGDPSNNSQVFKGLNFNILCCRYWWFEVWKGQRMSFPYWRLYWNKNNGAYVYFKNKTYISPDKLYLIPPHTPFSTGIENQKSFDGSEYFFKCGRINSLEEEAKHHGKGNILHHFVHFTLGFPFDSVLPNIYEIRLSNEMKNDLNLVLNKLIIESTIFSLNDCLRIYNLILPSIAQIPPSAWFQKTIDYRIANIVEYMERNTSDNMNSQTLAEQCHMSSNSFSRLFKSNVGKSPSRHLTQIRIDKACNLLHYTSTSIDKIAELCGFSDRYHLTKVFSKVKKTSPAAFRKSVGYY